MTMTTEPEQGRLIYPGEIRKFVLGGSAVFTLRERGDRFTYKVRSRALDRSKNWTSKNQDKSYFYVSVLRGPSNESDYLYMGVLRLDELSGEVWFEQTPGSKVSVDSYSWNAFRAFWDALDHGCRVASNLEFWHEGSCCVCGRKLTVPESIAAGIGPECQGRE